MRAEGELWVAVVTSGGGERGEGKGPGDHQTQPGYNREHSALVAALINTGPHLDTEDDGVWVCYVLPAHAQDAVLGRGRHPPRVVL